MNVGLDIDDTITRHPEFFALLSTALQAQGHVVVIITFRENRVETTGQLSEWGIAYDQLVTYDHRIRNGSEIFAWKAQKCREHEIDVMFEDDPDVTAHIDHERTLCLMPIHPDMHDLAGMVRPF